MITHIRSTLYLSRTVFMYGTYIYLILDSRIQVVQAFSNTTTVWDNFWFVRFFPLAIIFHWGDFDLP